MEHYTQDIVEDFAEHVRDNWSDYKSARDQSVVEGAFDDFREEYLHETYNSDNIGPFNEQYRDLVYFMRKIHEDEIAEWFKDWNNPQKIYETGMYILAKETIYDMVFEEDSDEENPVTENPVDSDDPQSNVEPSQ